MSRALPTSIDIERSTRYETDHHGFLIARKNQTITAVFYDGGPAISFSFDEDDPKNQFQGIGDIAEAFEEYAERFYKRLSEMAGQADHQLT